MFVRCFALAAVSIGAAAPSLSAGDCVPEWDPAFGLPGASPGVVFDYATQDFGNGPELFTSGSFTSIGGIAANRIARWNGTSWSALGTGLSSNEGYAIAGYGGDLYAAGYFNLAGDVAGTAKLARWDGRAWHSIGAQLELFSNQLWDLTTWDDGSGEALYIAGNYQDIGGVTGANYIAKWDGTSFSALGAPISGAGVPLIIFKVFVWDDGTGEALYAGGRFLSIDGVAASRVAKWDGTTWSPLGSGITGPTASSSINAMAAYDDGSGEALYVAGQSFTAAGGIASPRVARWNGSEWSAVGDGFANGLVWHLETFDAGNGEELYAFGTFTMSGTNAIAKVAKWDGLTWSEVGANDDCYGAIVHDDGSGTAMYVAGRYSEIAGIAATRIARLHACENPAVPGDLNGDFLVTPEDLAIMLAAWGPCRACSEDLDGDDEVGSSDLAILLANWS